MVANSRIDRLAREIRRADPTLNLRSARAAARERIASAACGGQSPEGGAGESSVKPRAGVVPSWADAMARDWRVPKEVWWERNDRDEVLSVPLGVELDGDDVPTGEVVELRLGDVARGGDGRVGALQGIAGSGKTVLVETIISGLVEKYSPKRVNLILASGDGGVGFSGFVSSPHVVRVESDLDMDEAAFKRLVRELGEESADRKASAGHGSSGCRVPDLVVIVEEWRRTWGWDGDAVDCLNELLSSAGSAGIHILIVGQYFGGETEGDVRLRGMLEYGISLRTLCEEDSQFITGAPLAADLSIGTGSAIMKTPRRRLTNMKCYDANPPIWRVQRMG